MSWLYGMVTNIRNWLYDNKILPSTSFSTPTIVVGNLSAGGTGKTPHVEYIINLLSDDYNTAILSRGYRRKTKGFMIANEQSNSETIGDEPYQMYRNNQKATIAVCEKRVYGISRLLKSDPNIDVVVLDDGFQHRNLKPGLVVLLTDYHNLYSKDRMLPAGTLRESKFNSIRADIVIVTKCPDDIKPIDMRVTETELELKAFQSLFFSQIQYEEIKPVFDIDDHWSLNKIKELKASILMVTGIVSPTPMSDYLQSFSDDIQCLSYPDHHQFKKQDIYKITRSFESIVNENKIIICTEKDAARIISNTEITEELKQHIYYLAISVRVINNENKFIKKIKSYVRENSRNSQIS